ncbi:MAG: UDP-N-acetylmuramate dehydrogenase [Treponematales bacterium]
MSAHTTFKTGGPADIWVRPEAPCFPGYAATLFKAAAARGVPVFILGGGANLLVADKGIRGVVLDTSGAAGLREEPQGDGLRFRAGASVSGAAEEAARRGLSGLEFLAGMPGTVGGALWMNARCYGKETGDIAAEAEILDTNGADCAVRRVPCNKEDFSYKKSPFQGRNALILSVLFRTRPRPAPEILAEMASYRADRERKGHYRFPSAGSAFKNNRAFGAPTGKIIDGLGLRGLRSGGAQVAPWHGNLIINTGNASSQDIRALMDEIAARVLAAKGFALENEIILAGDWE